MPIKVINCPLCKSSRRKAFDERIFRDHVVTNYQCLNCGLVFQAQEFNPQELDKFYSDQYRQVYQGTADPTRKDLFIQRQRADHLIDLMVAESFNIQSFLDIGSSAGILLAGVRDRFNSKVTGIEPGHDYRQYARENGLDVYATLDDLDNINDRASFDVICMSHVLEHISDPVEYLTKIRENYLNLNGNLMLEVPNLYCHDSFEIAHSVAYSSHTLRETIQQAGFEVIRMKKHGQPRSELLPLYITVVAKMSKHHLPKIKVERFVGFKRRIGLLYRKVLQKVKPKQAWLPVPDGIRN